MLVIFVLTRIIVRAVDGFYQTVERGAMSVSWLQADTAKATRRLTVVLIWIFAVTVAYPYIPGSDSEAFKGISVFVGLMVSLGSAGLVNQVMSGLVVAYSRALKAGEFVQFGNTLGTVSEVNMLSTKVITPKRETVTVPNAVLVSSPITNYSRLADERGAIVGTKVTIGYDTPWRQVHAMLTLAAAARLPGAPGAGALCHAAGPGGFLSGVRADRAYRPAGAKRVWSCRSCTPISRTSSTSMACRSCPRISSTSPNRRCGWPRGTGMRPRRTRGIGSRPGMPERGSIRRVKADASAVAGGDQAVKPCCQAACRRMRGPFIPDPFGRELRGPVCWSSAPSRPSSSP